MVEIVEIVERLCEGIPFVWVNSSIRLKVAKIKMLLLKLNDKRIVNAHRKCNLYSMKNSEKERKRKFEALY